MPKNLTENSIEDTASNGVPQSSDDHYVVYIPRTHLNRPEQLPVRMKISQSLENVTNASVQDETAQFIKSGSNNYDKTRKFCPICDDFSDEEHSESSISRYNSSVNSCVFSFFKDLRIGNITLNFNKPKMIQAIVFIKQLNYFIVILSYILRRWHTIQTHIILSK